MHPIITFTALTLCLANLNTIEAKVMTMQADFKRNRDNHPVWDLSHASNGKAVILEPEQSLTLNFCLRKSSEVMVHDFRFSNGNNSETVIVSIDNAPMGIFETPRSENHDWNNFMSTGTFPRVPTLAIGWHTVKVKFNGTADGIAIDKIDLEVIDPLINDDIFSCELTCVPDQNFNFRFNQDITDASFIVQESYKTVCPEVDNINIPIFNPSVQEYEITAALPQYKAFSNWRAENNTGCPHLSPIYWTFHDVQLSSNTQDRFSNDKASVYIGQGQDKFSKISLLLMVQFELEGKSKGIIDSDMGTILKMKFKELQSNVRLTMNFKGRYPGLSEPELKLATPHKLDTEWNTKDFMWTDKDYNLILIKISSNSSVPLVIDFLFLERRPMLADQVMTIHKDDNVIVEAVFSDFWWLNPDSMSIHLSSGATYHNASYFRIYRPIPWNSGYAQVFVLYQDGNARLLPVPPEGVDWIPFGSSVIIGQTDPTVIRPYASITDAHIDIDKLTLHLRYKDGGSCSLTLVSTLTETRAIISNIVLRRDPILFPFATFRSMYVSEGNSDVDHVSVNGMYSTHIMHDFGAIMGRSFVFHRKCMSRHLNLSPDIYIDIRKTSDAMSKIHLLQTESFQSLLQRIQNHRYRLWTPRVRNFG